MKLAGVVAVEVTGGPEIPFHPGRQVREPSSLSFGLGISDLTKKEKLNIHVLLVVDMSNLVGLRKCGQGWILG